MGGFSSKIIEKRAINLVGGSSDEFMQRSGFMTQGPYVWDHWDGGLWQLERPACRKGQVRFALRADRQGAPSERHEKAEIGLYFKPVCETGWRDLGLAVTDPPRWSGQVLVWAQSAYLTKGRVISRLCLKKGERLQAPKDQILAYTERVRRPYDPFAQRIAFAMFDPAQQEFVDLPELLFDPNREELAQAGYDVSCNEVISALRDPSFYYDPHGRLHMFFAARRQVARHPLQNSAVGHALWQEPKRQWLLCKPLAVAGSAVQWELPQFFQAESGRLQLLVNEVNWDVSSSEKALKEVGRSHHFRIFSADSLAGPFIGESLSGIYLSDLYGLHVARAGQQWFLSGFFEGEVMMSEAYPLARLDEEHVARCLPYLAKAPLHF